MAHTTAFLLVYLAIVAVIVCALAFLFVLICRALWKYIHTGAVRGERARLCKTLGEALKEERMRCKMTQEFVADSLGVSRQAVSKWENGTSDPSTSNLLAIAKLYGVSAEDLLRKVENND